MGKSLITWSIRCNVLPSSKMSIGFYKAWLAEVIYSSNCPNTWKEMSSFSDYPRFGPCPFLIKTTRIPLWT